MTLIALFKIKQKNIYFIKRKGIVFEIKFYLFMAKINYFLVFNIFLLFLKLTLTQEVKPVTSCSSIKVEALFILDSSDNIGLDTFNEITSQSIPSIIESLNTNTDNLHVGIVNYGNIPEQVLPLVDFNKHQDFIGNIIENMRKLNSSPRPIMAIIASKLAFPLTNQQNNLRYCMWLTDGKFKINEIDGIRRQINSLSKICEVYIINTSKTQNKRLISLGIASNIFNMDSINSLNSKLADGIKLNCFKTMMLNFKFQFFGKKTSSP